MSWEGFSYTSEDSLNSKNQFPFWLHISQLFEELNQLLEGEWDEPQLHTLLLHTLWEKFVNHPQYIWSHRRVRAESSGIALNAHSSMDDEIGIGDKGLKGLSHKLAEAALDALEIEFPHDTKKLSQVENSILHTLIREWGTKSYEFTLKKIPELEEFGSEMIDFTEKESDTQISKIKTLFRVHCYFGLNIASKTQDSLQHLKCYKECGGSVGVLEFLLKELGIK